MYAAPPDALRTRTRVLMGGASSASFREGLRAVRTPGVPCVRIASARLADENPRFNGRNLMHCVPRDLTRGAQRD